MLDDVTHGHISRCKEKIVFFVLQISRFNVGFYVKFNKLTQQKEIMPELSSYTVDLIFAIT